MQVPWEVKSKQRPKSLPWLQEASLRVLREAEELGKGEDSW